MGESVVGRYHGARGQGRQLDPTNRFSFFEVHHYEPVQLGQRNISELFVSAKRYRTHPIAGSDLLDLLVSGGVVYSDSRPVHRAEVEMPPVIRDVGVVRP